MKFATILAALTSAAGLVAAAPTAKAEACKEIQEMSNELVANILKRLANARLCIRYPARLALAPVV